MRNLTPADTNVAVAVAIGRFSQACNHLESQLNFTLTRLLPITCDMGRVLLVGNQLKRNTEILKALLLLPEIPIPPNERDRLAALVPRLVALNQDRSRFLHNPMSGGSALVPGQEPEPLMIRIDRQDGHGSAVYPLPLSIIVERTAEATSLWTELYINPVEYDLSQWSAAFPRYALKPYPTAPQPKADNRSGQRRTRAKARGAPDTSRKSEEEPPR